MKKPLFLVSTLIVLFSFSHAFASTSFVTSDLNLPTVIKVDDIDKYMDSGIGFHIQGDQISNDGSYCIVEKQTTTWNHIAPSLNNSVNYLGSCRLNLEDISPIYSDKYYFKNSGFTNQYFQTEDLKQVKIELYVTKDKLSNEPLSNVLSFVIVPNNGTTMVSGEGLNLRSNATCTLNGKKVDCAEMAETAKSWFKAGLWTLLFFGILFLVGGIFWLVMLIHALSNPIPNKILWVAVIFFVSFIGAIIYYFVIKRRYTSIMVPNENTQPYQMNVGVTHSEGPTINSPINTQGVPSNVQQPVTNTINNSVQ